MKKTLLAMTSALVLAGAMSTTASAQSGGYYDRDGIFHSYQQDTYQQGTYQQGTYPRDAYQVNPYQGGAYQFDTDRDGVPNQYDSTDDRYAYDQDRDGLDDRRDLYDDRSNQSWDRDRDGENDRYDDDDNQGRGYAYANDRDRDGVADRYDNRDNRYDRTVRAERHDRHMARKRYNASRYHGPRNYRYARYNVGNRLPTGYYGSSYYVDYRPYGLTTPPRGYRWNRVGNDVYLVSTTNGMIRDVMYSLFR